MVNKLNVQLVKQLKQIKPSYMKEALKVVKDKDPRSCAVELGPRCKKVDDLACYTVRRLSEYFKRIPKESVWYEPECYNVMECGHQTRFDDMYWKHSDKNNRSYAQTWVEYPNNEYLPQVCVPDIITDVAPMETRTKADIKKLIDVQSTPPQCVNMSVPCPKFKLAKCAAARSGNCRKNRTSIQLKRLCAPFPSYADSARRISKRIWNRSHCHFENMAHMCDLKVEATRLKTIKKVPSPNDCIC